MQSNHNVSQSAVSFVENEETVVGEVLVEESVVNDIVEEKRVFPNRTLEKEEISVRLSHLGKIAEGYSYAYLKATCTGMSLTDVSALKCFKHLQYVDVSNNNLKIEALQAVTELPFLVHIQASINDLQSAALNATKYLQVVVMNHNTISTVENVYQPELCTLDVGYNKIKIISFTQSMPEIKFLDFRYNLIEDITNLDFPNLDSLYLGGNSIKSLVGLERLQNLRVLHVRFNPIKLLDGFSEVNQKLQYINLRNCQVATLRQVKKLRVLKALETLVVKGCPIMGGTGEENNDNGQEEEDTETRIDIIASVPRLKRLNKDAVTLEERNEANKLMAEWFEEGYDEEEIVDEQHEEENYTDE